MTDSKRCLQPSFLKPRSLPIPRNQPARTSSKLNRENPLPQKCCKHVLKAPLEALCGFVWVPSRDPNNSLYVNNARRSTTCSRSSTTGSATPKRIIFDIFIPTGWLTASPNVACKQRCNLLRYVAMTSRTRQYRQPQRAPTMGVGQRPPFRWRCPTCGSEVVTLVTVSAAPTYHTHRRRPVAGCRTSSFSRS